jgi:arylsulfatase A-like enzyme
MAMAARAGGPTGLRAAALLGVAVALWDGFRAPGVPPAVNLVLVSIDTLRADHLGSYGYQRDTSPHLDRFARRSTRFTRAVAQSHSTLPSHMSLFTSRYYSALAGPEVHAPLPDAAVTLAELLRARGFATWGFVDGGYLRRTFGFDQGFDHYYDVGDGVRLGIRGILQRVEQWLDTHRTEPFFLFVHCYDVHTPYASPPPFDRMFVEPGYGRDFDTSARNLDAVNTGRQRMTADDLAYVIARYDGAIRYTDEQLGGFFANLERRGLLDSTVVIVTSDHGEEFLDHGTMMHWQMYLSANLHVPLLVFVPGRPPGTVDATVELTDVLPTALDLLGLPPHPAAVGRSLVPLIENPSRGSASSRIAYAEPSMLSLPWRTVVSDGHQLLHDLATGRSRLFDTRVDPGETTDVAEREPAATERLRRALEDRRRRSGADHPASAGPADIDDVTRRQLEALGYVGEGDAPAGR